MLTLARPAKSVLLGVLPPASSLLLAVLCCCLNFYLLISYLCSFCSLQSHVLCLLPPAFLAAQYLYCCTVYLCHGARHCRMSSLTTGAAAVVSAAVFCSVLAPVNGCMTLCWCCSLLVLSPPAGGLLLCCRLVSEDFCCAVTSCWRTFAVRHPPI